MDTPISEAAMTGFGLGAAIGGLRPIHIHIRVDFLLLAMSQLVNQVSPFIYSTCGGQKAPLTIRAIVGRGWGQGWQHSKSLHSAFAHVPGLKVVLPTRARDAKGLLTAAIRDDNPVLVIEHRWLYWAEDEVPEEPYATPLEGGGAVLRPGSDLTIVATSWMAVEALRAAEILARSGVDAEVVDPQVIAPFDDTLVLDSARALHGGGQRLDGLRVRRGGGRPRVGGVLRQSQGPGPPRRMADGPVPDRAVPGGQVLPQRRDPRPHGRDDAGHPSGRSVPGGLLQP